MLSKTLTNDELKSKLSSEYFDINSIDEKEHEVEMKPLFNSIRVDISDQLIRKSVNNQNNQNQFLSIERETISLDIDKFIENLESKQDKRNIERIENDLNSIMLSEDNKKYKVGKISTIEKLVEETYDFDNNKKEEIMNNLIRLQQDYFRYRKVFGDGNCYYRAIMFAYLENIVLSNQIDKLVSIMIQLSDLNGIKEKLNEQKSLPVKCLKLLLQVNLNLSLTMLLLIYRKLKKQNIEEAYQILYLNFNYCSDFDRAMVLLFRIKCYQYIDNNKDKVYHKDFAIQIGNLLPNQYEVDDSIILLI